MNVRVGPFETTIENKIVENYVVLTRGNAMCVSSCLIPITTLGCWQNDILYFIGRGTKSQEGAVTCLGSHM